MDALLAGAVVAFIAHLGHLRCPTWLGWAAAAGLTVTVWLGGGTSADRLVWTLPTSAVATAILIAAFVAHPSGYLTRLLMVGWLRRFGVVSYAAYLWNTLPYHWWESQNEGETSPRWMVPFALVFTWVVAEASWRWIERPSSTWAREVSRQWQRDRTAAAKETTT